MSLVEDHRMLSLNLKITDFVYMISRFVSLLHNRILSEERSLTSIDRTDALHSLSLCKL